MKGAKSWVAGQFESLYGIMLYVRCYGHALNVAVKDVCLKPTCLGEARLRLFQKYFPDQKFYNTKHKGRKNS